MNLGKIAVALGAVSLLSLEIVNLYKQVMGRSDRYQMPATKIFMKGSSDDNKILDDYVSPIKKWASEQNIENCMITSDRGDILRGYYLAPNGNSEPKAFVLASHGFHSNHTHEPFYFINHYHDKGFGYFFVDHVASDTSSGNYVGFDYYESLDLIRWIDYLTSRFGDDITIILHGVSMGGATVLQLAGKKKPDAVKLIISDCAYTSAKDEFTFVAKNMGIKNPKPVYDLINGINKKLAGFDLGETDVRESVKHAQCPILFIHGGIDDFVPTRMAYELYNLCPLDKKELKIFDNAKHSQSYVLNSDEYNETIDNFINKHLSL